MKSKILITLPAQPVFLRKVRFFPSLILLWLLELFTFIEKSFIRILSIEFYKVDKC